MLSLKCILSFKSLYPSSVQNFLQNCEVTLNSVLRCDNILLNYYMQSVIQLDLVTNLR